MVSGKSILADSIKNNIFQLLFPSKVQLLNWIQFVLPFSNHKMLLMSLNSFSCNVFVDTLQNYLQGY